ncbi:uncharacterized protein LOC128959450 [Oppia nitens]|uniref:uncharacterized protein LOC128959450 n=1 Tax=Oppia nitens TaxID=1686743 RepID=UPI0023DA3F52|nr:uncharacterized protein LOC128959450 [Oppia nitens]
MRLIIFYLMITAIVINDISKVLVESKVQLCESSPKWTVNNGRNIMKESLGNVTLVILINASYRFGLKQASSLENMLRFLKKSGLKDINFIIINSKDNESKQKFKELSQKVSFNVYQETDSELVWTAIDGGKDDMFIFDRCGLLNYYIPFPLSIVHAQQPILQAALLSTYFDNPCTTTCDLIASETSPSTTTIISNSSTEMSFISRPDEEIITEILNETISEPNITTIDELKDDNVFNVETTKTNELFIGEDGSGSGSGDQPIQEILELNELIVTNITGNNDTKDEEEWKVLDIFRSKNNRTDKEVFDDIYNISITQNDYDILDVNNETQTTTIDSLDTNNITNTTGATPNQSQAFPKRTRFSLYNSAARAKCETFNKSMCDEWSTDRLLRVRLCCLTDMTADDDSGFGCGHFERSKCNQMLPLIKCCLKDFSQLLENYYQSMKTTPQPLRQQWD